MPSSKTTEINAYVSFFKNSFANLKITIKDALDLRKYISIYARRNFNAYKRLIQSIDELELKKILYSSQVNDLTYCLRYIYDFDKVFGFIV